MFNEIQAGNFGQSNVLPTRAAARSPPKRSRKGDLNLYGLLHCCSLQNRQRFSYVTVVLALAASGGATQHAVIIRGEPGRVSV